MKKVEKFKKLCDDLQKRKLDLDSKVVKYSKIIGDLNEKGIHVQNNEVKDPNNQLTIKEKQDYENCFQEFMDKLEKQKEWINERSQAFGEAFVEIEDLLKEKCPQLVSHCIINRMKYITRAEGDLKAIIYGESMINDIESDLLNE